MCHDCWVGYGSPKLRNNGVTLALSLLDELYDTSLSGGDLHIVVDDWNLKDSNIEWCLSNTIKDDSSVEFELAHLLLSMPLAERASALYWFEFGDREAYFGEGAGP